MPRGAVQESSESTRVRILHVRGTSFTSFRTPTMRGGGCAINIGAVGSATDAGTFMMAAPGPGIDVIGHANTEWGRDRASLGRGRRSGDGEVGMG